MGWYVGNGGGVSAGGVEGRAVEEGLRIDLAGV